MTKNLSAFLFILLIGCNEHSTSVTTGLEGRTLPAFDLLLVDSTSHINTGEIKSGTPVVLFSFEPWCPYCKAQTEDIISNISQLKAIRFYLLTNTDFTELRKFYAQYQLSRYPNLVAGIDERFFFDNYFKTNIIPYLAVYGKDNKLKRVFSGKISIKSILDAANE